MPTVPYQQQWAIDFLHALGNNNPSVSTETFVVGWEIAESGRQTHPTTNNPLNTTQPEPGATSINSVGVKSYPTYQQGIQANAQVLQGGGYPNLLHALQTNDAGNLGMNAGQSMAANIASDLSYWVHGTRSPIATSYISNILGSAGVQNAQNKLGGGPGGAVPGGTGDTTSTTPASTPPGACAPWDIACLWNQLAPHLTAALAGAGVRIGLFLLAVVLVIIGGIILIHPDPASILNRVPGVQAVKNL